MTSKVSGVYKITCIENGKFYIGSSENTHKRHLGHFHDLRKNIHANRHLQRAWNKYGKSNFVFEVIEIVEEKLLLEREQTWLDATRCYDRKIGFNLSSKANSTIGIKLPRSAILKKSKKWIVTNPNGASFEIRNLTKFCMSNGIERSLMGAVAKGKRYQHKGWQCRPANMSFEEWIKSLKVKIWILTDPNGKEILTDNLFSFCKENKLSYNSLRQVAYGVIKRNSDGWSCKTVNHKKPRGNRRKWIMINPNKEEIISDNLMEFCKLNNLSYTCMIHVAHGYNNHHKQWQCKHLI